jgi:sterol desaturase/sphingolipid hydroxylase (fatty acid hydroxylase superfamily)
MDLLVATPLGWKIALVGGWFAALFLAERLAPATPPPQAIRLSRQLGAPGWRRLARNAGFWIANSVLSLLIVVPVTRLAADASLVPQWRPVWWSGVPGLLLDLVLLDFLIYWWHRANHRVAFLWRFHDVHHRDEFLDTTSAVRFHSGEVVLSALARAAIMVLLALPLASVLSFEILVLLAALFHHSNIRLPRLAEAPLSWLIVTPSIHWVHHHAVRSDTDSNYGTVFSFWDRLFGSRSATPRSVAMPIGVEGESEKDLLSLTLLPFKRRKAQ